MSLTIRAFDAMPESEAADVLRSCCGSSRWVDEMISRRPFKSLDAIISAADDVWRACAEPDWLEAFSHHPRIGANRSTAPQSGQAASWSSSEQSGVRSASTTVQDELAEVNRQYEERFGYIYIVCATGRSADDMLEIARDRLSNAPETEIRVAAEEQRKITELRLRKLFKEDT